MVGLALELGARTQDRSPQLPSVPRSASSGPELVAAIARDLAPLVDDPTALYRGDVRRLRLPALRRHRRPRRRRARTSRPGLRRGARRRIAPATVLFTGGGIVPASVFEIGGLTLVHVHTGFLPHVRGADVLLWSLLVRGRPGVSAFFMTPGLDDGDVLAARETDAARRSTLPAGERPDDDTLYRAVFSFVDPLIRAELLVARRARHRAATSRALRGEPQDLTTGVTFHFMHPTVRGRALATLFRSADGAEAPRRDVDRRRCPSAYQQYYEQALAGRADALRGRRGARRSRRSARSSIRNRQTDYAGLPSRPELLVGAPRDERAARRGRAAEWPTLRLRRGVLLPVVGRARDHRPARHRPAASTRSASASSCADRTVLEIGCNTGFLSLAIAPAARRVVAFEINPYLIEIGRIGADAPRASTTSSSWSSRFEDFDAGDERFDDVLSFANHHTYDGNTRQALEEYFERCHALLRPGGRLIFESHPPALEGRDFGRTVEIIERYFDDRAHRGARVRHVPRPRPPVPRGDPAGRRTPTT